MLFSDDTVAKFMNARFECAWESVRKVPKAEIDFGDGVKLTRTLQGNVATYLCTKEGRVVDIIPGLMAPLEYVARAELAAQLMALWDGLDPAKTVAEHHRARMAGGERRLVREVPDMRKMRVERPLKEALGEDTDYNVTVRMPKIHALLAEKPLAGPADLKVALFRDILGYDIEDPYLGLAPMVLGGEGGRTESGITNHE